jgi:hypothetical protein
MHLISKSLSTNLLIAFGSLLILISGSSAQGQGNIMKAPTTGGAVIYQQGASSGNQILGRTMSNLPANMPHITITKDVPDLFAIGYGNAIVHISLQGSVRAAAVYTERNYKGDCETVTPYRPNLWSPSNTVGMNIQSIQLNSTCLGPTNALPVATDLKIISGSSRDIKCPSGYTRRNQDLNEGAGGDFTYMCIQFGPRTTTTFVRQFGIVSRSGSTTNACNPGYKYIGDANAGTKGPHLYVCIQQSDLGGLTQPIFDVDFVSLEQATDVLDNSKLCGNKMGFPYADTSLRAAQSGGRGGQTYDNFKVEQGGDDYNQGAGGRYIFSCTGRSGQP